MNYKKVEIKQGINFHKINTQKFKTDIISVFLTIPLNKDQVTLNSVMTSLLRRGSVNYPTQEIITKNLEKLYGAEFNCGVEKSGDNQILKFYIESINKEFLPNREDILILSLKMLLDIVLNPLIENNGFKQAYLQTEIQTVKRLIENKIDDKSQYSLDRCIEEMYKDKPYGLYKYGDIDQLDKINTSNLYEHYKYLISHCKIDIFVSGNIDDNIENQIKENELINKLEPREVRFKTQIENINIENINNIEEKMDISQGKLVIGLNINSDNNKDTKIQTLLYNAILGGTANSKLFQNVREKNSLAYTANSTYMKQKNVIFIRCGIEIQNKEKAINVIKEQLEDMKQGKFTQEDLQNAKQSIISIIKGISNEQDTEIIYYLEQELSQHHMTFEEYIENVKKISIEDIIKIANDISINTIYFLKS